jgi:hypothetical protein
MSATSIPGYQRCGAETPGQTEIRPSFLAIYLLLGIAFGVVLARSEVLSWFRMEEMFHFQSFRMYGIIGSSVVNTALSFALIKAAQSKD